MKGLLNVPSRGRTKAFYDGLVRGTVRRGIWGKNKRFDAAAIAGKPSVQRYFVEMVRPYIARNDRVLDLGCGPGGFLAAAAPLCGSIVGADIAHEFVLECRRTIALRGLPNAEAVEITGPSLPFPDSCFDVILMVDTIHHLDDVEPSLREARRVLKPEGVFLVFEPNKFNPLLWLMCLFDRNEWGLLRLGSKAKYQALLTRHFAIGEIAYNGLLVGPDGSVSTALSDFLSNGWGRRLLGWMSPKIFIAARKR